jgi:hypothetical protein
MATTVSETEDEVGNECETFLENVSHVSFPRQCGCTDNVSLIFGRNLRGSGFFRFFKCLEMSRMSRKRDMVVLVPITNHVSLVFG